jgi:hypothetical protein
MALTFIDQVEPQAVDTSKLEQDLGDQAGLQPLPLSRMIQQAGRLMSPKARNQDTPWYGKNTNLKVDPALHDLTIQRNQRNQQTIESWNPIEAENKQRLNNTNPNPRSKPAAPNESAGFKFLQGLGNEAELRRRRSFQRARSDDSMKRSSGKAYGKWLDNEITVEEQTDLGSFLTSQERQAVKSLIFDHLDSQAKGRNKLSKDNLPLGINSRFPELGNDMLYEWNARRQKQLRENSLDMLEIRRDTIRGI